VNLISHHHNTANNSPHHSGLLVINKPKDWTSFDVVAKIRGKLKVKKVGHTGTLDPMATGVLVLCLGKATKLAQELTGLDKEYVGEITLGATSNTDDAEGEVIENSDAKSVSLEQLQEVLKTFEGEILQLPPQFSAKKVNGKRAYAVARKGGTVKLKPVQIKINEIEILDYQWPKLKLRIDCGKGTYIRSIARDVGEKLGVGGYLSALERTRVGDFTIQQAKTIEEVSESDIIKMTIAPRA